jgi:large subunit ribosomal protein L23
MENLYNIIYKPTVSEKGMSAVQGANKYPFKVNPEANKIEIAKAIEFLYRDKKIKVLKVNTMRRKGKQRRMRTKLGWTSDWKKAIVTLREGDVIDMM